jgi:hypothetical protein
MNFKTTLILAAVLAGLGIAYLWRPRPDTAQSGSAEPRPMDVPGVARDVLEDKITDVVKVVFRQHDGEEWVFEKESDSGDSPRPGWRMTSPVEMKVVAWEVDRFGRELGDLKYEVSYRPGDPGAVSAVEAGLDPPEHVVTLSDAEGTSATFEVGKPASSNSTYVRLADDDKIYVGMRSLRQLFKRDIREYRDKQPWTFKPQDAKRVEIVDRSGKAAPVTYAFARDGSRWMMESPVTAKATKKVDDMLQAMGRLRATEWHDDKPERLAAYGLEPASLTIRTTVEEEIPADEEDEAVPPDAGESEEDDETAKQPKTEDKVYELHLSDRSPIGEDTKTYMRIGDESMVAIVMKTVADNFKPVMSEWREMRIATPNVASAARMTLSNAEGSATLVKREGRWWFAEDDSPAEDEVVRDLLTAIDGLNAVAFVDGEVTDPAKYGLDQPQAGIELTVPGVENVERIAVGGYTDTTTKRLVYVRRDQVASVAKVRASDISDLLKGPRAYRDRTIFNIPASRIGRISLSTENQLADGRIDVDLRRGDDEWVMISPVEASVRNDRVNELVESLGSLRAEAIIDGTGELSPYGLHAPAVKLVLSHLPPVEYRFEQPERAEPSGEEAAAVEAEPSEGDESPDAQKLVPVEVQPPPESLELLATAHDGRYYAKRADRQTVYEVGKEFYDRLLQEYRTDEVLAFDDATVQHFSIRSGNDTHAFKRSGDRWIYEAEPDLPLDAKKVDNLLLQMKDLHTQRYVTHTADDLAGYGLADPFHRVTVALEDGSIHTLLVSNRICNRDPKKGYYATLDGSNGVFLVARTDAQRFKISLDDLEAGP